MDSSVRRRTTLPSGRTIILDRLGWPDRPWSVQAVGSDFVILRDKKGRAGEYDAFKGSQLTALVLDARDAEHLCRELNAFTSVKAPTRAPPGLSSGWSGKRQP